MSALDQSAPTYAPCAVHGGSLASFQCDGCERKLCFDCVKEGKHLTLCAHCGERAHLLQEDWQPSPEEEQLESLPAGDILYQERRRAEAPATMASDPLTSVFNLFIVPMATIVMVTSLLFFLLNVRSLFLEGSANLKWLGFWFVFATVLIARFGKMEGDQERVGCYSAALTGATILTICFGPWQRQTPGLGGPLINGLILLVVWRFATGVASGLSLEGEEEERIGQRLYGLERLAMNAWQRARGSSKAAATERRSRDGGSFLPSSKSPNMEVARLAAMAMLVFALGEPALLRGPPEVASRGMASMVSFLLATGLVLGAGATLDVLRRVKKAEGKISSTHLPRRMLATAFAMVCLLSIALAMPGVRFDGAGSSMIASDPQDLGDDAEGQGGQGDVAAAGDGRGSEPGDARRADAAESNGQQGESSQGRSLETSSGDPQRQTSRLDPDADGQGNPVRASGLLISALAGLGKWLRYPAFVLAFMAALWGLQRLLPLFGGWRGLMRHGLDFLARMLQVFRRGPSIVAGQATPRDPWRGLEALQSLPPEEVVRQSYGRLLLLLEALDYPRAQHKTPQEVLAGLPRRFRSLQPAIEQLTELYVAAAYGPSATSTSDGAAAWSQLQQLRRLSAPLVGPAKAG